MLKHPEACDAFEGALTKNSTLKSLRLDGMSFIPDHTMAKILRVNSSLEKLCLTNYCMERFVESAKALGSYNTTLKILQLSNNFFHQDSGMAIAKALQTNSTIKVLDLADNSIGEAACIAIASALKLSNQTRLECLNIDNNLDNDDDSNDNSYQALERIVDAFISTLDQNSMIKYLSMNDDGECTVSADRATKIKFYLGMNLCGRNELLKKLDNLSHEKFLQCISYVSNNTSQLFYLLRSKPSLLLATMPPPAASQQKSTKRENDGINAEQVRCSNKRIKLF